MKRTAPLLVLALTSSMLVTSPSTADSLSGATLSWRISDCAFDAALPSCGSLTESQSVVGNVTKGSGAWEFTGGTGTFDPVTGATVVKYAGSVTIGNTTRGGYSITFANPQVSVSGGAGVLLADIRYRPATGAPEVAIDAVKIVDLPAVPSAPSWSVTPPWEGVGTPATPAPVDGKQFAQPLIDVLPASLKGWFWATGTTGANPYKAPGPVGLSLTVAPTWTPFVTIEGGQGLPVNKAGTITVRGTGFDPSKQGGAVQGLYVVFGPNAATVGYGMSAASAFGAAQYLPVAPDANGSFETTLTIKGSYADSDGRVWNGRSDQLGVSTWAAHSHATTAWDTFTPLSFAPPATTLRLAFRKNPVRAGKRAIVRVRTNSKGAVRVVKAKRVLARVVPVAGVARLRLPVLKPGQHALRAVQGDVTSGKVVLRVKRRALGSN